MNDVIFSNKVSKKVQRHFLFWIGWFFLSTLTCLNAVRHVEEQGVVSILLGHSLISVNNSLSIIPFCYFVIYYLVPRFFLLGRSTLGLVILFVSIAAHFGLGYLVLSFMNSYINPFLGVAPLNIATRVDLVTKLFIAINGPLVCCGAIGSVKFLKAWHNKQVENIILAQENTQAELLLLKAQVNPHFLFNTLNNIYSFTLVKSPLAGNMIERLSNIFSYMASDGQKELVPLRNEIQMVEDYIGLETVRYGDRLDFLLNIEGSSERKLIAPLLLIPFVENSFKHGSSKILTHPRIKLSILIEAHKLIFILTNNKPSMTTQPHYSGKGGIGLKNASKRLLLLYPQMHNLKIESDDSFFSVQLTVQLKEMDDYKVNTDLVNAKQNFSYATT